MMGLGVPTILKLSKTLELLGECWTEAERVLQDAVRESLPGADEEHITNRFHECLADRLRLSSQENSFASTFLQDLQSSFPSLNQMDAHQLSEGIIAELDESFVAGLQLQTRSSESRTSGDLGLVINRPKVELCSNKLKIADTSQGLLCQAKLKGKGGKWGKLTKRQKDILPSTIESLSILLYSYSDKDRCELKQFAWQLCQGATLDEVQNWLKADCFCAS